jgi:hypothetical protein
MELIENMLRAILQNNKDIENLNDKVDKKFGIVGIGFMCIGIYMYANNKALKQQNNTITRLYNDVMDMKSKGE